MENSRERRPRWWFQDLGCGAVDAKARSPSCRSNFPTMGVFGAEKKPQLLSVSLLECHCAFESKCGRVWELGV